MNIQNDFITETKLEGVFIIKRPTFEDPRGFFREFYRKNDLETRIGFSFDPAQANHSHSIKDTLRGIHIAPWHKLITVTHGAVQQIVVDTRVDSPTFAQYESITLNDQIAVFVPAGCGNGFLATTEEADYIYLATDYWSPGKELYLLYNDPDVKIQWETHNPIVSEKDLQNKPLRNLFPEKF
jgi:dTDP-4-dehydrorhamnose 3,5-epimerase